MSVPRQKAALGVASKRAKRDPSPERLQAVQDARRELAAAKLEAYIKASVESAPALTADQRQRLALLLRGAL